MSRSTKFILGTVIALVTAGTLYAAVGKQFHQQRHARYEQWRNHHQCSDEKEKNQPAADSLKWK